MQRRLLGNFGNYLFLFFLLQVQFVIKGSNAVPGNSQGQLRDGKPAVMEGSVNTPNPVNAYDGTDVTDFESFATQKEEPLTLTLPPRELELIMPRARNGNLSDLSLTESPDYDQIDLPGLRSSAAMVAHLRPKSVSRQSGGYNSGSQTPGLDYDWVDISSQASEYSTSSSKIARMLYSTNYIVSDKEISPISFDSLCSLLEATADKEMGEDELLLICKRVVAEPDTFIKALKDLPLFIQTYPNNQNAVKINSILYCYLSHSGEMLTQENMENGSLSSMCSSRGSDSTLESPPNSPITDWLYSNPSIDKLRNSSTSPKTEDDHDTSVLDEINRAQSHVPHIPQPSSLMPGFLEHGAHHLTFFPRTVHSRFMIRHLNNVQVRSLLYPLPEESKTRTMSSEAEDECQIEEID